MLDHVLKPLQPYRDHPEATDVEANPHRRVWVKRFSRGWESMMITVLDADRRMIRALLASRQVDDLSADRPSLSTVLPSGARIEGTIEIFGAVHLKELRLNLHRSRRHIGGANLGGIHPRIPEDRDAGDPRHGILEQLQMFAVECR
jgi:hypothetical protein